MPCLCSAVGLDEGFLVEAGRASYSGSDASDLIGAAPYAKGDSWMLSFQIINSGRGIQIFCDSEGLATLAGSLEKLRATAGHIHLRTPSNGGHELSEKTPWGNEA